MTIPWQALAQSTLISLVGVVVATLAVLALGGLRQRTLTIAEALDELTYSQPAFRPAAWALDDPGRKAALAVDASGKEVGIVFVFGDSLVARLIARQDFSARRTGERLTIATGDLVTPDLTLRLSGPLDPLLDELLARSAQ